MTVIRARERAVFACPFCGKRTAIVELAPDNEPGITHETPYCEKFGALGLVDFMAAVNKAFREQIN